MPIGWMGLDKHVDAENIAQNIGLHNGLRGCIRNQMAIFQGNDLIGKARSQIDIVQNGDDAQAILLAEFCKQKQDFILMGKVEC